MTSVSSRGDVSVGEVAVVRMCLMCAGLVDMTRWGRSGVKLARQFDGEAKASVH